MSDEWLLLAGGAALAGLVQGISGFAFAMVAMSVWVWGLDPRLAAVMAVAGALVGQCITLRGWDKDLLRSVIQNFSLLTLVATLISYLVSGMATSDMWPKFAVVVPSLLLPSLIGARLYHGLSPLAFRRVVLLLTGAGAAMIVASLPAMLRV
jgi:uncharacterized membrane protein YfcA